MKRLHVMLPEDVEAFLQARKETDGVPYAQTIFRALRLYKLARETNGAVLLANK